MAAPNFLDRAELGAALLARVVVLAACVTLVLLFLPLGVESAASQLMCVAVISGLSLGAAPFSRVAPATRHRHGAAAVLSVLGLAIGLGVGWMVRWIVFMASFAASYT